MDNENVLEQALASLAIEGLYLSEEGKELVRKKMHNQITHEEFLVFAKELAIRESKSL